MFVYVFFPVAIFTYFSDPTTYEKDLIALYKKTNIPESPEDIKLLQEAKDASRKKRLEELRSHVQKNMKDSVWFEKEHSIVRKLHGKKLEKN